MNATQRLWHRLLDHRKEPPGFLYEHLEFVVTHLSEELDKFDTRRLVFAEQRVRELEAQLASSRNGKLEAALQRIARWHDEFPATSQTWPNGAPMSYGACWGANGERDYMRQVALEALKLDPEPK